MVYTKESNRTGSTLTCWSHSEQARRTMRTRKYKADSMYDLNCRDMDLQLRTCSFYSTRQPELEDQLKH